MKFFLNYLVPKIYVRKWKKKVIEPHTFEKKIISYIQPKSSIWVLLASWAFVLFCGNICAELFNIFNLSEKQNYKVFYVFFKYLVDKLRKMARTIGYWRVRKPGCFYNGPLIITFSHSMKRNTQNKNEKGVSVSHNLTYFCLVSYLLIQPFFV